MDSPSAPADAVQRVAMDDPQAAILARVADKRMRRYDVAVAYTECMHPSADVDFRVVNAAIMERWSLSGLRWIKAAAWRRLEGSEGSVSI